MMEDNKRSDSTTLLAWVISKPLACDATIPDTYAESRIAKNTCTTPGSAAEKAARHKIAEYANLASTHVKKMFCPVATETVGTWNAMAFQLVQEIGRRKSEGKRDFSYKTCP